MISYLPLFCALLRSALGSRQQLLFENLALRQQVAVLSRQSRRPRLWSGVADQCKSWATHATGHPEMYVAQPTRLLKKSGP